MALENINNPTVHLSFCCIFNSQLTNVLIINDIQVPAMKTSILLTLLIMITSIVRGQVIYVDISNNTGIADVTQQHPFNTIKEGINAAVPGNQVMIMNGTYIPDDSWSGNDHTLLLKAGVSLAGESRDSTIIAGIVVDQAASSLSTGLEKLKFDEFHFVRATQAGPFPDKNKILDCRTLLISLSFGPGVPVNDTTPGLNYGFRIENNDLGMDGAIEFKQGSGVSEINVEGNICGYIDIKSGGGYTYLIDGNDVSYGILDKSEVNTTTISNNRIANGTITDLSGGNQWGVEDEIIENNTINADQSSPAFIDEDYKAGIIAKSRSVTIRNNTLTCTGNVSGIRSSAGAPLHILNNTITVDEVQLPNPDPYEATSGIFNYSGWGYVTGNKIHGGGYGYFSKAGTTDFAGNEIESSYYGFYSLGAEEVRNNIIKNCKGDGMILDGLKGPVHHNDILNNGGAGIRIIRVPIDLGGGPDNSPGNNTIMGNGNFDLYIETANVLYPVVYARYNKWDHETADQIALLDIRDGSDSTGLVFVDFTPFGGLPGALGPGSFSLDVLPNPGSGITVISWNIAPAGSGAAFQDHVTLRLFDAMGKVIRTLADEPMVPGVHRIVFDASSLPPGIYYWQLNVNGSGETRKMVVL